MRRHLASLALPLSALGARPARAQGTCAGVTLAADVAAAVDRMMTAAVREGRVVGVSVGIARRGCPVFAKGYGRADAESDAPAAATTVYRTASTGKQFTAAAVLLLAERGALRLDDPLATYLPDVPRAGDVTLRQLLTHTSGIHNYVANRDWRPGREQLDHSMAAMVDYIARQPQRFDFEPGTAWSYSNSGYYLLGAVIEKVSGTSFAAFLRQHVFVPAGMKDTAVDDPGEVVARRARDYVFASWPAGGGPPRGLRNAPHTSPSASGPAGGFRSTAPDFLAFHAALLGGRLLKPASVRMMTEPARLKDGRPSSAGRVNPAVHVGREYGFGVFIDRDVDGFGHPLPVGRAIAHSGGMGGFNTNLATYTDHGVTVAILANSERAVETFAGPLAKLVVDAERAARR